VDQSIPNPYVSQLAAILDSLSEALDPIGSHETPTEGVVQTFAAIMAVRLESTFNAISLLLKTGHLDEALVLIRRQVEDSIRLQYLWKHRNRAQELIVNFIRRRDNKVRRELDRLVNHPDVGPEDTMILRAALRRRKERVDRHDRYIVDNRVGSEEFPSLGDMALELGRGRDLVPYSSASDAVHSAVSGSTDVYVRIEGRTVGIHTTVVAPGSAAIYGRAAITSTVTGVYFSLLLLGSDDEAEAIMESGVYIEGEMNRLGIGGGLTVDGNEEE
jgi:hypothetical protein